MNADLFAADVDNAAPLACQEGEDEPDWVPCVSHELLNDSFRKFRVLAPNPTHPH